MYYVYYTKYKSETMWPLRQSSPIAAHREYRRVEGWNNEKLKLHLCVSKFFFFAAGSGMGGDAASFHQTRRHRAHI